MESVRIFVSSVQKELENERVTVQQLIHTDPFLSAHCIPVLYEYEPASPKKAVRDCLETLNGCQIYVLIVWQQYGSCIGKLSITHHEYRSAKERKLPVGIHQGTTEPETREENPGAFKRT